MVPTITDLTPWLIAAPAESIPEVLPAEDPDVDDDDPPDPDDDDDENERIERLREGMPTGNTVGCIDPDYQWRPHYRRCRAPESTFDGQCTLARGHAGDHICHGGDDWTDEVLARWAQFPAEVEVSRGL